MWSPLVIRVGSLLVSAGLLASAAGCTDLADRNAAQVAKRVRARDYQGLAAALESPDTDLRCRAAKALAWVRDPAAAAQHEALMSYEGCGWEVRTEAAWRLLEERAVDRADAIAAHLTDPAPEVRWNMARVLGQLKQASSVPALDRCAADPDAFVAAWCRFAACRIRAQGRCKQPNMDLTDGKTGP